MAIIVEGHLKASFSIAITRRCRRDATPFPGLFHFTLDTYIILLSVKQGGIKYHFKVLGMTGPGIEPKSPGPLANTTHLAYIYIYIYIYIYTPDHQLKAEITLYVHLHF